jgi:hypothetical protein
VELELLLSEVGVQLDLGVIFSIISCNSNLCSIFGSPPVKSDQTSKREVLAYLKNFSRSTYPLILVGYSGSDEF